MSKYIAIGKIKKPHALAGAFHLILLRQLKKKERVPPHLFLKKNGVYHPFFIESWRPTVGNGVLVKVEDIDTPEDARKWNGCEVVLPPNELHRYFTKDANDLQILVGYTAYLGNEKIGEIRALMELPAQTMAVIFRENKEVLVPLNDDLITDINQQSRCIVFSLPDGFLDI